MQEPDGQGQSFEPEKKPSVGARLRAAREARGLTIESIARALRLNPAYFEALETDTFDLFPAQPYIRVYLKTLAQHLGLDPVEILNDYRRQQGLTGTVEEEPGRTRIDLAAIRRQEHKTPWAIIIMAVIALSLISVFVQRMNRSAPVVRTGADSTAAADTAAAPMPAAGGIDSAGAVPPFATDTVIENPAPAPDAPQPPPLPPEPAALRSQNLPVNADSLVLTVSAKKDSAWVQVFADGQRWTNFVKAGRPRVFRAADSLNVQVGYNANLSYELNGSPVVPSSIKGVATFRIDHDSITEWPLAVWRRTFRGRLSAE